MKTEQVSKLLRDAFDEGFSIGHSTRGQGSPQTTKEDWDGTDTQEIANGLEKEQTDEPEVTQE